MLNRVAIFGLFAVAFFGCSHTRLYDGPRLPEGQVSFLESVQSAKVFVVDGRKVRGYRWELLPGEHHVVFSAFGGEMGLNHICETMFVFEPGATYRTGAPRSRGSTAQSPTPGYIVNVATGEEHEIGCSAAGMN